MLEPLGYGNFYQNYYTPYFCGDVNNYSANQYSGYQAKPQYDTVELSNKQEEPKKELSKTAKVGIFSLLALGAAIAGDYILAKGKHVNAILKTIKGESKPLKEAAENAADDLNKSKKSGSTTASGKAESTVSSTNNNSKSHQNTNANVPKAEEPSQKLDTNSSKVETKTETKNNNLKATVDKNPKAKDEPKPVNKNDADTKALKQAEEKTAQEAKAEAAEAAKKKADAEAARLAKKQVEFERALDFSKKYVDDHMAELDKVMLDKDGNLHKGFIESAGTISLDDLIKPYKGKVEYFYHATTPEAKASILKEGFNQRIAPKHGHLDGVGGTYFSVAKDPDYGSAVIKAKFNGKIAEVDTNLLDDIKCGNNMRMYKHLTSKGVSEQEAADYGEAVIREYLQRKIFEKGYQGIIGSGQSYTAGCKYFAALDPKLIQIVE